MILRVLIQFAFQLAEKEEQTPTFSLFTSSYQNKP
jgi:hypothetical protein